MAKGKTKEFKETQCRFCGRAHKIKFGQGMPCCPLTNPRIKKGLCLDRKITKKPIGKVKK